MESIFKLGILMSVVDHVSGPGTKIGGVLDRIKTKAAALGPQFDQFKKYGLIMAAAGTLMINSLAGAAQATMPTQAALGELSSVGVSDLATLEAQASRFANRWSGTTKAQFVGAAYDIKSGISSLTDSGVADFTRLAALTGKATKSTTAEMTSLFATGYGIYKDYYSQLSDLQFGELFSGGIAASVQSFKTTGSGMAQAISQLGATATTASVPLEEQLSILGMLQATMSGSEAGTKYKALLQSAANAGAKLNLQFLDANNQLLSLPEILTTLQARYGSTLDSMEKLDIQKAFGTQEAVAVIDLFYGKIDRLTKNIDGLGVSMRQGSAFTAQMASAMNQDINAGTGLLGQQWHNLVEVVGNQLLPVLIPLFAWLGNILVAVQELATAWPNTTRAVVLLVAGFALLLTMSGAVLTTLGVLGMLMPQIPVGLAAIGTGLVAVKGFLIAATTSVWGFTTALLANPITWVVLALVALGGALVWAYNHFESVRRHVDMLLFSLGYFIGILIRVGKAIWAFMIDPLNSISTAVTSVRQFLEGVNFYESGQKILGTLSDGIRSVLDVPADLVRSGFEKVRQMLPFSDAKEGPFSALTLNGSKIMSTLGVGIQQATPALHKTVAASLAGVSLAAAVDITPAVAAPRRVEAVQERVVKEQANKPVSKGMTLTIEKLVLPNVDNAESFIRQLQELVEGYDG